MEKVAATVFNGCIRNFSNFKEFASRSPYLEKEEEVMLWRTLRGDGSVSEKDEARDKIIIAYLRIVDKEVGKYYRFASGKRHIEDLTSEGILGLFEAVKRFDYERGSSFTTYALWWVRSRMTECSIRTNFPIKGVHTSAKGKNVFRNLSRCFAKYSVTGEYTPREVLEKVANEFGVTPEYVDSIGAYLKGELSLDRPLSTEQGLLYEADTYLDMLEDDTPSPEIQAMSNIDTRHYMRVVEDVLQMFSERDQVIFRARRLRNTAQTLNELSKKFKISRERVRQIEVKMFETIQQKIVQNAVA